jgi:hypothetical protein
MKLAAKQQDGRTTMNYHHKPVTELRGMPLVLLICGHACSELEHSKSTATDL